MAGKSSQSNNRGTDLFGYFVSGKIKEYHSSLSEIVRRYTEERFQFIALELTTDEIIDELKSKLKQEQIQNLKIID